MLNLIEHFHCSYRQRVLCLLLIVVGLLVPVTSTPALADTPLMRGTVSAGSLSVITPSSFSFSALIGSTITLYEPISVRDLTGAAAGWNLAVTSTQFATSGGATMSTSTSTITSVTVFCTVIGTCSQDSLTNGVTTPITIPAGVTAPAEVEVFKTAAATGTGVYTVVPSISIAVPAGTLAGVYTNIITVTLSAGP